MFPDGRDTAYDKMSQNAQWHIFRYLEKALKNFIGRKTKKGFILWEKSSESTSEQPIPVSQ